MSEEDRSYNESDILLQNIQSKIKDDLQYILENKGESPNAIVDNYYAGSMSGTAPSEVKYVMGELTIGGDTIHDFSQLIYVGGDIEIDDERAGMIANKLEKVRKVNTTGYFRSDSLKSIDYVYTVRRKSSFIAPNLETINKTGELILVKDNIDLSSLNFATRLNIKPSSSQGSLSMPKLASIGDTLNILPNGDYNNIFFGLNLDVPSLSKVSEIRVERGDANTNADIDINTQQNLFVSHLTTTNNGFNLNLNVKNAHISGLRALGNAKLKVTSKEPMTIKDADIIGALVYFSNLFNAEDINIERGGSLVLGSKANRVSKLRISSELYTSNNSSIQGEFKYIGKLSAIDTRYDVKVSADDIDELNVELPPFTKVKKNSIPLDK
jgi:hypothetical protein